jgi:hypothetical protein
MASLGAESNAALVTTDPHVQLLANAASFIAAENAEPGSCQPSTAGTSRMCAVEEIGSNSVMPWTTPNTATLALAERHEPRINASRTNFDHRCSVSLAVRAALAAPCFTSLFDEQPNDCKRANAVNPARPC